jgi:Ni2+-binding GTPase involved in maturation of urease and hydrogenase
MHRTRVILVGGFLGAGKTTAIVRLASTLSKNGLRCGVVTNDQGDNLVDTSRVQRAGFPVREVTGGCFCCRFDDLTAAVDGMCRNEPLDVVLAEPVGSCTDILATVAYPLRLLHGTRFEVAPLSVLVDPDRCRALLATGVPPGAQDDVDYIARTQIEEAEVLVLAKCDTLPVVRRETLCALLQRAAPHAQVLTMSATSGEGIEGWYKAISSRQLGQRPPVPVDYDRYASGEALLGWLNATVALKAAEPVDGNRATLGLASGLEARVRGSDGTLAHLKVTLASPDASGVACAGVALSGSPPQLSEALDRPIREGTFTVNLRAVLEPRLLERHLREEAAAFRSAELAVTGLSAFRPGRPVPTHRLDRASPEA